MSYPNTKLLAQCQALRDVYYSWATMEYGDNDVLQVEASPPYANTGSALWKVQAACKAGLTALLGGKAIAEDVWETAMDSGVSLADAITYVHANHCKPCPWGDGLQLVVREDYESTAAVLILECGDGIPEPYELENI